MRSVFENKIVNGEYASRYIASWIRVGGKLKTGIDVDDFRDWLRSLIVNGEPISENDIYYITELGRWGKLEFQENAKRFLNNLNK